MFRSELALLALVSWPGLATPALAAPCCGGNSAAPAIIAGDDQAQMTASLTRGSVIGDAPGEGLPVFRADDDSETSWTYRVDGAVLLSDRFQAGASLPVASRAIRKGESSASSTRIGDVRLNLAYEALPEWSYSAWKPRGFAFAQLTLPTGTSIHDSRERFAVDATGRGFYSVAAGALLQKRWSSWDAYVIPEAHYSFERSFGERGFGSSEIAPGWGGSVAVGAGIAPVSDQLRFGIRVQPVFNQAMSIRNETGGSRSTGQRSVDASLELTYLAADSWSVFATYTDQTLIGPAVNSTLSRTVSMAVQHRWER